MAFDYAVCIPALPGHTDEERDLLESNERPVVLLERRPASPICEAVAPFQSTLGFMLAYTPLHLLLLEPEGGFRRPGDDQRQPERRTDRLPGRRGAWNGWPAWRMAS